MLTVQPFIEHQAYNTHYNYIKCLSDLAKNTNLQYAGTLKKADIPNLEDKRNLIDLTKKSLIDEYKIVKIDKDYSYASTSWLPIKSYYLIFNILLTIEYIFKIQKSTFRLGHSNCVDGFTRKLQTGEIKFSNYIFNQVFDQTILSFIRTGANLSMYTGDDDMYKMAIRKIAKYKVEDWKHKNHIINLRKKVDKIKYQQYLTKFSVSIFDFPYQMRLRSNYRDFAFIDGVTTDETAQYFKTYLSFTVDFVKMLEGLKKDLVNART